MIVYRTDHREEHPRARLREIAGDARAWASTSSLEHDRTRDLLIELGIVEAGVADALSPECDTISAILCAMRDASHAMARLFVASWLGAADGERRSLARSVANLIDRVTDRELPASVMVGVPEGYAYYALYPEQYVAAARNILRTLAPSNAVCIGLRSIGTSLSAVVAAALERDGCAVRSYTVRPHGHPFDRQLTIAPDLERDLCSQRDALFIVVDEGPGLSGSSFAAVASALASLGIPDSRIVLMPSWEPDESRFVSESARLRWQRHLKFTSTFEEQILGGDRLARALMPGAEVTDLSAGAWREHLLADRNAWPAVHPQHERRKYLLRQSDNPKQHQLILKFAGLGRIGSAKKTRAERIAAAGFGPKPRGLSHGFMATELLDATPLAAPLAAADVDTPLLERLGDYLAFIAREFPADDTSGASQLGEMIEVNTREALGDVECDGLASIVRQNAILDVRPVALDGRMLPHEWLRLGDTLIKTDATDHHDDHFFPGTQDMAWDIAATAVEFQLDARAEGYLVERYRTRSGDRCIAARVPFYRVAYLAHRVGYATLAAQTLGGTDDGDRWEMLVSWYRGILHRQLGRISHAA